MSEGAGLRFWTMRLAFTGLALMLLLAHLLPMQTTPRAWGGPDLLLCFALVWSARRPEFVPLMLLATLFLLADFLLSRPPGLAAALMLMGCAQMRSRGRTLRDNGFGAEWMHAAIIVAAIYIAQRFAFFLFLLPMPQLSLSISQAVATMACYPLLVLVSAVFFGVRMAAPRDFDAIGGQT